LQRERGDREIDRSVREIQIVIVTRQQINVVEARNTAFQCLAQRQPRAAEIDAVLKLPQHDREPIRQIVGDTLEQEADRARPLRARAMRPQGVAVEQLWNSRRSDHGRCFGHYSLARKLHGLETLEASEAGR
jgi:hypothetical protein